MRGHFVLTFLEGEAIYGPSNQARAGKNEVPSGQGSKAPSLCEVSEAEWCPIVRRLCSCSRGPDGGNGSPIEFADGIRDLVSRVSSLATIVLVAEWIHFTLFGINVTHNKTKSVHFWWPMNSTKRPYIGLRVQGLGLKRVEGFRILGSGVRAWGASSFRRNSK